MQRERWIRGLRCVPGARLRLFCFPFAGGGALAYREWSAHVPSHIDILGIALPGRETRFGEPLFHQMRPLVRELVQAIEPLLDRPFAFFGHSMGAEIAFELARALRRRTLPMPRHLFVSARRAPQLSKEASLHDLPRDRFIAELRRYQGTPEEVLASEELLDIFLPVLRADFSVIETNDYEDEPPLPCPITALHGENDHRASEAAMRAWAAQTSAAFRLHAFPGGHFYLKDAAAELLELVCRELDGAP